MHYCKKRKWSCLVNLSVYCILKNLNHEYCVWVILTQLRGNYYLNSILYYDVAFKTILKYIRPHYIITNIAMITVLYNKYILH